MKTDARLAATILFLTLSGAAGAQGPAPPESRAASSGPMTLGADPRTGSDVLSAFAAPVAPPLSELLDLARVRSPLLAAGRARLAAAGERTAPAGALTNPMVEGRLLNMSPSEWRVGKDESSMLELGVRQALPFPGKREARRAVARAEVEAAAAELAAAERQLALEVQRLYARLFALDREHRALDEAHELIELMGATVSARYGAGEGEQESVLKVQLALSQHDERRIAVEGEREEMVAELRRWLDLPPGTAIGEVESLPPIDPLPEDLPQVAADRAPEVVVARAMAATAERMVATEQLELKPDFSAGAGLGYRGSHDPAVTLALGIELPFWRKSRQEPLIRAARQELVAAQERERDAGVQARAETGRLLASWNRVEGQLRLYEQAVLPQTAATFDAARISYLNARGDFSTVVEDYNLWLEARVRRSALEAERFALRAAITALVGPPAATPATGAQP